jgi:hypothetical protein
MEIFIKNKIGGKVCLKIAVMVRKLGLSCKVKNVKV